MGRIKKYKLILISALIIGLSSFSWLVDNYLKNERAPNIPQKLLEEMTALNTKYNLVSAEPLDQKSLSPYLASLLNANVFQASVIETDEPKQDLIVKFKANDQSDQNLNNILILKLQTGAEIEKIAVEYGKLEGVKFAEPNYKVELTTPKYAKRTTNTNKEKANKEPAKQDPLTTQANPTSRANPTTQATPKNIIIGLIDSGVDVTHPDLQGKFVQGWDFINNQKEEKDEIGHGTHIAGIITKYSKSALIMPLKFTDSKTGRLIDVVKAIKFASDSDKSVKIINLSLGLKEASQTLKEAVDYAQEKNIIIVAAAGNDNSDVKYYPAAWPEVISVAAVDSKDEKVFVSNYGNWVKYSAQGQDIYSTVPDGKYAYSTGTSQAAPVVTAKIAEILSNLSDSANTLSEIDSQLKKSSKTPKGKYADKLGAVID